MERKKDSLGVFHHNLGTRLEVKEEKYKVDYSREFYLFDVIPTPAPRMTQSDKWKTNPNHIDPDKRQRKAVTQYWQFKNELIAQSFKMNFNLKDTLDIVFFVPLPDSMSEKKKESLNGMPCKKKPDLDNYAKGFLDCLLNEDGNVWDIKAKKIYAYRGSILIYV